MRSPAFVLLTLILVKSTAVGGDYIRIDTDTIPSGAVAYKLGFLIERTCPDPVHIRAVSNGFAVTATGSAEFQFSGFEASPNTDEWFFFIDPDRYYWFTNGLPETWGTEGIFLTGASAMAPAPGVPVLETEYALFDLYLDVRGEGELLIDSAFVFSGGWWKWAGLTCGLGGAPDRPLFLAKDGSDSNHPIHITVFDPPCGDANLDGAVDVDDIIYLGEHVFSFLPAPNPWQVADVDCSGQLDIDDIVYLLYFVFASGPAPCDFSGDGVPDC